MPSALAAISLLACGTRTLIDAMFGPTTAGETAYASAPLRSLRPGMISPVVLGQVQHSDGCIDADREVVGTFGEGEVGAEGGQLAADLGRVWGAG
jgi:hypothetical protein